MGKTLINPPELARPRGFSHGVLVSGGRTLFLAGQTASDHEGQIVAPGDLVAQYEQVLSNLKTVLEAAGGKMEDIVKATIFVKDRDDYLAHLKQLGVVHRAFFGNYYPATALFEVSRFFQDEALLEIEGIAVLGADEEIGVLVSVEEVPEPHIQLHQEPPVQAHQFAEQGTLEVAK